MTNLLAWGNREATNTSATLTFWDADIQREVFTFPQREAVTAVAFSPDGKLIATFNADSEVGVVGAAINLWRVESGALVRHFGAAKTWRPRANLQFSPDGRWPATGGRDGLIKLWEVGSWRLEAALQAHLNPVGTISFSPDGTRLVTGTGSADEVAQLGLSVHRRRRAHRPRPVVAGARTRR